MPDDVIIKLRELVATTRFRHAWALLDQDDELHRHTGLEAIRRLVAARDCTMADLVRLMTTMPLPSHDQAKAAAGYERTRAYASASTRPSSSEARAPGPDPMRKVDPDGRQRFLEDTAQTLLSSIFVPFRGQRVHSGDAVARTIRGNIDISGSRQTPFGEVLGFVIRNQDGVHGPIAALDPASIERLRTAQEAEARMVVQTIPAHGSLTYPSVTRVSVALS
jgi:hypothetical protein